MCFIEAICQDGHAVDFFEVEAVLGKAGILEKWDQWNPDKKRVAWICKIKGGVANVVIEYIEK